MRLIRKLFPFLAMVLLAGTVAAQSPAGVGNPGLQADRIAQLQQQIADAKGSADNAWMLISAALVLLMTGPGLALFYGGLVRRKNVLSTMMHSFILMAVVTVLWVCDRVQHGIRRRDAVRGGRSVRLFCMEWAPRLMRITRRPFRSRPSWSTS